MNVEILTDDQSVKGYDYPIEVKIYTSGVQIVPTSATITINDPDGDEVLASTAMSVAVAGALSYTLGKAELDTLWENAVIEIDYVVSTVHYKAVFFFDCVLNALKCNVIDDDLKAYAPALTGFIWSTQTTYTKQILEAFNTVKRMLKDKGHRPAMLIDGGQVRELIIMKAFEMICFDFAKARDDIWFARYEKYSEAFKVRFDGLNIKYDEDETGTITSDEKEALGQVDLVR
jgi:hypothetical protein